MIWYTALYFIRYCNDDNYIQSKPVLIMNQVVILSLWSGRESRMTDTDTSKDTLESRVSPPEDTYIYIYLNPISLNIQ